MSDKLPEVKNKKKIQSREFEKLANRIKEYLKEEANYIKEHQSDNASSKSSKFLIGN